MILCIVQASYESPKLDAFPSFGYQKAISRLRTTNSKIGSMDEVRSLTEEENSNLSIPLLKAIK